MLNHLQRPRLVRLDPRDERPDQSDKGLTDGRLGRGPDQRLGRHIEIAVLHLRGRAGGEGEGVWMLRSSGCWLFIIASFLPPLFVS